MGGKGQEDSETNAVALSCEDERRRPPRSRRCHAGRAFAGSGADSSPAGTHMVTGNCRYGISSGSSSCAKTNPADSKSHAPPSFLSHLHLRRLRPVLRAGEYNNIFRFGNRNAASHLWSAFLLERAPTMTYERFELIMSGYCAISGSPVTPSDYTRYQLTLPLVSGTGTRTGYMYYCCWPCVCDTQDFIRVDTKNVTTASGTRQYHVRRRLN